MSHAIYGKRPPAPSASSGPRRLGLARQHLRLAVEIRRGTIAINPNAPSRRSSTTAGAVQVFAINLYLACNREAVATIAGEALVFNGRWAATGESAMAPGYRLGNHSPSASQTRSRQRRASAKLDVLKGAQRPAPDGVHDRDPRPARCSTAGRASGSNAGRT
jgi:hypothetical protein